MPRGPGSQICTSELISGGPSIGADVCVTTWVDDGADPVDAADKIRVLSCGRHTVTWQFIQEHDLQPPVELVLKL